ncbi:hypothetical protein [Amycolatopsis decaplanina]|uniref:Putative secreted protein n=1 Tax=Amycolatopsis decaplanina DSM 44594 TaxID=1284240 RepID=M2ZE63_9PSEU|nr:hypothetical protein [Amycolatopsis decaplanina]EME58629.1 putative secreted protein [Amycolatopsis decaplanina DSM 44594]
MRIRSRIAAVISVAFALVIVLALILMLGRGSQETPEALDLAPRISSFAAGLDPERPYRPPDVAERRAGAEGFTVLLDGGNAAGTRLQELGFSIQDGVDSATGRRYTLVMNEPGTDRAWGLYLIDRSAPPSIVVEIPHPNSDLRTEQMGLSYFRMVPGAVLLMAGAHRRAGTQADVAHRENSMFHAIATELAERGYGQIQFHGFHDSSQPGKDIVLSAGAARVDDTAWRMADRLTVAGFTLCHAWAESCRGLEGNANVQGKMAAANGTAFMHIEVSSTIRADERSREAVVRALVAARAASY